jgi:hypothetical protein
LASLVISAESTSIMVFTIADEPDIARGFQFSRFGLHWHFCILLFSCGSLASVLFDSASRLPCIECSSSVPVLLRLKSMVPLGSICFI